MLKIFFIGLTILVSAIVLNGLVSKLGIAGWYQALQMLSEKGNKTFTSLRWIDYAWLFFFYPFLLGGSSKLGEYVWNLVTRIG